MQKLHSHDKALLAAIAALYLAAVAYGASSSDAWLPLLLGGGFLVAAFGVALSSNAGTGSQIGLPILGMAMTALLIHAAHGRGESHFAVFAFLSCTIVYRHWLPVVAAAATIALHHLTFNFFQAWGWGPICFSEVGLLRVVEHAAYVAAQAGMLIVLALRANRDAGTSAQLADVAHGLLAPDGRVDFTVARTHTGSQANSTARQLIGALQHIETSISQVNASIGSVAIAAQEIASGNADLRLRTEQTAANLQQAAGAMTQFTQTVNQTADSARTANQLAASASEVAGRGGAVVAEVVSTMNEINQSSKKIADIIGTIDGIAFQTNILALNAAVEAARAGEQGRGFAVVASEVRSLAQRSAAAAREIKGLIGASVEKVESGSRLVADAGSTMTEIVRSVQRVSDIIGEISAAAAEQSRGIVVVNQTVSELDHATQQNAALVQQASAAAESLKEQSRQLAVAISGFRLSGHVAPHSSAAPVALAVMPAASLAAGRTINKARTPTSVSRPPVGARASDRLDLSTAPKARIMAGAAAAAPAAAPTPARAPAASAGNDEWESF